MGKKTIMSITWRSFLIKKDIKPHKEFRYEKCWLRKKPPYFNKFKNSRYTMKYRCSNPKAINYHNYWWRWISVCIEWMDFVCYFNDMYASMIQHIDIHWEKNTSIDRIDNNWNYCKDNCRRATNIQQLHNSRASELWYWLFRGGRIKS